jgi:hypothetical protein
MMCDSFSAMPHFLGDYLELENEAPSYSRLGMVQANTFHNPSSHDNTK